MAYETAKGLWDAIRISYSKAGDKSRIVDLISRSYELRQGDKDILTHSSELRDIHTELDHCWPGSTDLVARAQAATLRLCQLLFSLRPEFEVIRSQLYNQEIEPTFEEVVTKLLTEESRLQRVKNSAEHSSYAAKTYWSTAPNDPPRSNPGRGPRENLICSYCKKPGHLREKCYQLHGRPPHLARAHVAQQGDLAAPSSAAPSATAQTNEEFQKMMLKEFQNLRALVTSTSTVIGSTSMANIGKTELALNLKTLTNNSQCAWILDSGATDHMTNSKDLFLSYEPVRPGKYVQTADGSLLSVIGFGTLNIPPIGHISNVLYVPQLFTNLISVQKLAILQHYTTL